jgi:hexulose-6-phosphate isomerase
VRPDRVLTAEGADTRQAAQAAMVAALDRALWLGAGSIITALSSAEQSVSSYELAYHRVLDALLGLRFEAQKRAVGLACEVPARRFLLSPLEVRALVDRANSAWIKVCLDFDEVVRIGSPGDWLRILGHRVGAIRVGEAGLETVNWPAIRAALAAIRYDGFITIGGAGDPAARRAEIASRIVDSPASLNGAPPERCGVDRPPREI